MFDIENALYHVFLYGYFEHAYAVYFSKIIKGKDESLVNNPSLQLQQLNTFESIRDKLRGNTYLSPTLLGLTTKQKTENSFYPFTVRFTPDELYWFNFILAHPYSKLYSLTKQFYKHKKLEAPLELYPELMKSFRTVEAIEFVRKKVLKKMPTKQLMIH